MRIFGGVSVSEDGISTSVSGMHLETVLMNNINDNILGFNKVGYQRKAPVLSSFAELVGAHAFSEVKDTQVGRIKSTDRPLDLALAKEGYFQCKSSYGIKLTRDGRFKLDKSGNLLTLENDKVLSITGQPIKFPIIPEDLKLVKIAKDGVITYQNPQTQVFLTLGQLSVVSNNGSVIKEPNVKQGYTEDSNVNLQSEIYGLVPVRRAFEANRQMFIVQNDRLQKVIQELGRPS